MEKLLFVDACIRGKSRTKQLCDVYLEEFLKKNPDTSVETVKPFAPVCWNTHTVEKLDLRDSLIRKRISLTKCLTLQSSLRRRIIS